MAELERGDARAARAAYRALAKELHPDRGGTHEQMCHLGGLYAAVTKLEERCKRAEEKPSVRELAWREWSGAQLAQLAQAFFQIRQQGEVLGSLQRGMEASSKARREAEDKVARLTKEASKRRTESMHHKDEDGEERRRLRRERDDAERDAAEQRDKRRRTEDANNALLERNGVLQSELRAATELRRSAERRLDEEPPWRRNVYLM